MIDLKMTKYQAALVRELVCPWCRRELVELAKRRAHCFHCQVHFVGEVVDVDA